MPGTILVTRPSFDRPTHYLFHWSRQSLESAKGHAFTVVTLDKEKANKKEFEGRNAKLCPVLVFFNGHGSNTTITGHNYDVLVEIGKNDSQFSGKVVYAISCGSARELGRSIVSKKAVSFVGYEDDFILHTDRNMETRPLDDELAKYFLEHSRVFVSSLMKGNTIGQAYEKARRNLQERLTDAIHNDPTLAADLYWDYLNFVALGDLDNRI
ncbi:Uncharacterised protein [uncultured archaeon]|nr:Uncharacterised protein [uncultured archaeon]